MRWRAKRTRAVTRAASTPAARARHKFLRFFPGGFTDPTYLDWERDYKWETHLRWEEALGRSQYERLLKAREFDTISTTALRVEQRSRHSMIFSFEKMALRDAVKSLNGARAFAEGLFDLLHGSDSMAQRFERWVETVAKLPRKGTRVLTWPVVTVFPYIAQPDRHFFFKPTVTRKAAVAYNFPLPYESRPSWKVYSALLEFAERVRKDVKDMKPRDMIDLQSFIWVQGSDEYE